MKYLLVEDWSNADAKQIESLPPAHELAPHTDRVVYIYACEKWFRYTSDCTHVGTGRFLILDSRGGARVTNNRSTCDYDEESCYMWDEPSYIRFLNDEEEEFEVVHG